MGIPFRATPSTAFPTHSSWIRQHLFCATLIHKPAYVRRLSPLVKIQRAQVVKFKCAPTVYDDYKNRLGNLTLLEKPINIVAGNDFYKAKQAEYGKSGNYLTRSLVALTEVGQNTSISRINVKLEAFPAWNAASIEKRHALLIALAQEVWKTTPTDV